MGKAGRDLNQLRVYGAGLMVNKSLCLAVLVVQVRIAVIWWVLCLHF